ncbi:MAG TPA: DUF3006 domain-containing protein [Syntrophomonas sp.]|jgi:hypothetical protein|nr:DUF3006 domain-containing protein [Syntrophomonas sp.]
MRAVIDRFEGELAVMEFEDGCKNIPRQVLPTEAREGDVLVFQDEQWRVDVEATGKRKEKIEKLAEELWED